MFSAVFLLLFDTFFYVYIYCKTINAEFNKLKNSRSTCSFFSNNDVEHTPTFANNFDFIWIFSYSHLFSPYVVTKHTKMLGL